MIKEPEHYIADKDIQVILGTLLRVGVIVSMLIVLTGGLIYLAGHQNEPIDYRVFKGHGAWFSSMKDIFKALLTLDGAAIIQFGILMLIFTPVARIVFSIFSFLLERDYLYVTIGLIVLCIIMVSLNGGIAG